MMIRKYQSEKGFKTYLSERENRKSINMIPTIMHWSVPKIKDGTKLASLSRMGVSGTV